MVGAIFLLINFFLRWSRTLL